MWYSDIVKFIESRWRLKTAGGFCVLSHVLQSCLLYIEKFAANLTQKRTVERFCLYNDVQKTA